MKLWARFRRFWHCLFHSHKAVDVDLTSMADKAKPAICIFCECGKKWD